MKLLNRKGQGLTEYGIILLLIVFIGGAVWSQFSIKDNLSTIYSTITTDLHSIAGETTALENYDTGNTKTINGITFHETSLALKGGTIYWYTKTNGMKQYTNNLAVSNPLNVKFLDKSTKFVPGTYQYMNLAEDHLYVFFRSTDGNIYKMSSDGKESNTLTKFTGTLPYIDNYHHIVSDEYAAANKLSSRAGVF